MKKDSITHKINISPIILFEKFLGGNEDKIDNHYKYENDGEPHDGLGSSSALLWITILPFLLFFVGLSIFGAIGFNLISVSIIICLVVLSILTVILSHKSDEKRHIRKHSVGYKSIKERMLEPFKQLYVMPDGSVKFGYELVKLENSTAEVLVIDRGVGGKDIYSVDDESLKDAYKHYQQNEILSDATILNIINAYHKIMVYKGSIRTQQHYQELLDKKYGSGKSMYNKLNKEGQQLSKELKELKELNSMNMKENESLINRILTEK